MNGTMLQTFHWYCPPDGRHWSWVAEQAAHWKAQGFSALWFPPANKGFNGANSVGYDVFDLWDLGHYPAHGTVKTKHGAFSELQTAINRCHELGLHVYADIVFNHKMGAPSTEWVRAQ